MRERKRELVRKSEREGEWEGYIYICTLDQGCYTMKISAQLYRKMGN